MNSNVEQKAWFEPILSVHHLDGSTPTEFQLFQNYPNPFNPETTINYQLAKECLVRIAIYNINGQEIITLVNNDKPAGQYAIKWNATDAFGNGLPSGIYICRMEAEHYNDAKKLILMR